VGDVPLRQVVDEQLPQDLKVRVGSLITSHVDMLSPNGISSTGAEMEGLGAGVGDRMTTGRAKVMIAARIRVMGKVPRTLGHQGIGSTVYGSGASRVGHEIKGAPPPGCR